jgi:hypothetical protein
MNGINPLMAVTWFATKLVHRSHVPAASGGGGGAKAAAAAVVATVVVVVAATAEAAATVTKVRPDENRLLAGFFV